MNRQQGDKTQVPKDEVALTTTLAQLIPFVAPKKDALLDAVRRFWSIPDELHMSYVPPDVHPEGFSNEALLLRVESANSGERWELSLALSASPKPAMVLRHVSGTKGLVRLLKENVAVGVPLGTKQSLREAWTDFFPFRMMDDSQYREVFSTQQDISGRIRIGYRCNQDCWFCWQGRRWPSPPDEMYHTWVEQMANLGVRSLNITGGEPTTYGQLPALIAEARDHQMSVSIQTNAIKLGRSDYLQALIASGLSFVMASYHSADSELSDRMTRAPKTHKLTQNGLSNLAKCGVPFTLNCVVERTNVQGLPDLAKDIVNRFVRPYPENQLVRVSFSQPFVYFEGGWSDAVVPLETAQPYLVSASKILTEAGIGIQISGTCGFPLCVFADEPKLLETQMALGFSYDESEVSHREFTDLCNTCSARQHCHGLRSIYAEQFGTAFLRPIPPPAT